MQRNKKSIRSIGLFAVLMLIIAACGGGAAEEEEGNFVIGVSNTLVGNGWREQMICAIKAEALASGVVDQVVVVNRNGGSTEQIADLESLISQGVNAIILNPTDRDALNSVIGRISSKHVVGSVDRRYCRGAYVVTMPGAYVAWGLVLFDHWW